jgi:hydroxymethylpyrimidine pyrophosphatase-like HAD family hydrolase
VGLTRLLDKLGLQKTDVLFVGDGLFPGGNDYSVYEAGIRTMAVEGPEETMEIIRGWVA